jgi:hypothetical protein
MRPWGGPWHTMHQTVHHAVDRLVLDWRLVVVAFIFFGRLQTNHQVATCMPSHNLALPAPAPASASRCVASTKLLRPPNPNRYAAILRI